MSALGWKPDIRDPHSDVRNVPGADRNFPQRGRLRPWCAVDIQKSDNCLPQKMDGAARDVGNAVLHSANVRLKGRKNS
jgi:hypothetical protein